MFGTTLGISSFNYSLAASTLAMMLSSCTGSNTAQFAQTQTPASHPPDTDIPEVVIRTSRDVRHPTTK